MNNPAYPFVVACGPLTDRCKVKANAMALAIVYAKQTGIPATVALLGSEGIIVTEFVSYPDGTIWEP